MISLEQKNHTISIHFAKSVLSYFINDDQQINAFLTASGISLKLFSNPRARITPHQLSQLIKTVSLTLKDEFLGLSAQTMPLGSFSLLAKNALYSHKLANVYSATELALTTLNSPLSMKLSRHKEHAEVCLNVQPINNKDAIILTELVLLIWHRFPSWLANKEIPLLSVELPFSAPAHEVEYKLMFPTKVNFNADVAKLVIPLHCLDFPCQRSPEELTDYIAGLPEYWFKRIEFNESISQQCLRYLSLSSDSSMSAIAQKMNKSVRTLRRNLATENTQFNTIKAQFLRDNAIHLITDTSAPIEEIALSLGYTEASTFSRVFKQWTGSSPRDYRNAFVLDK